MQDDRAWDRRHGIKQGSPRDEELDRQRGLSKQDVDPDRSLRSQRMAFARPGARRRYAGHVLRENLRARNLAPSLAATAAGSTAGSLLMRRSPLLGAELGGTIVGTPVSYIYGRRAARDAARRSIREGDIRTGVPKKKITATGGMRKAYQPGAITYHQQQASLHARKKVSAQRGITAGLMTAGLGGMAASAAHRNAWAIGQRFPSGRRDKSVPKALDRSIRQVRTTMRVERYAPKIGAVAVAGGLGLAGASAARRIYHARRQNMHTQAAQSARRQREAALAKAQGIQNVGVSRGDVSDNSQIGESFSGLNRHQHGRRLTEAQLSGQEPMVAKQYYYESAPTPSRHRLSPEFKTAFGAGLLGGAAAVHGPRALRAARNALGSEKTRRAVRGAAKVRRAM